MFSTACDFIYTGAAFKIAASQTGVAKPQSGAWSSHPHGVVEGLRCPLAEVELICDFSLLFAAFGSGAGLLFLHNLLGLLSLCRRGLV